MCEPAIRKSREYMPHHLLREVAADSNTELTSSDDVSHGHWPPLASDVSGLATTASLSGTPHRGLRYQPHAGATLDFLRGAKCTTHGFAASITESCFGAVHRSVERTRVTDWLTRSQQRTWLTYMRVYHRLEYEMNRQLQAEFDLSLGDYTVLNALSNATGHRMQLTSLATLIGWERSRLSHHLLRMTKRGLVDRLQSNIDGRATDAALTATGRKAIKAAAPHHVAWVRRLFFSDLSTAQERELADILTSVYETILREGTLPRPIEFSG